jgi:spore coat polysaccharide biosynthesis protein SpsF
MDFAVLIQARCGSSRVPNKVLLDLNGKPELLRVVERVKKSTQTDDVFVITSIDVNNLPLIKLCAGNNIRIFAGSEEDVLDRYYQCARLINAGYIIRVTADCPVFDWSYLDEAIEIVKVDDKIDYLVDLDETFPDGLDIEIIKFSALEYAWKNAELKSEREHVTLFLKNNRALFNIFNFSCPIKDIAHHRWTLDEQEDYELLGKIYSHFLEIGNEDFLTGDILDFLHKNPELSKINSMYARNEGLAKSLRMDGKVKP